MDLRLSGGKVYDPDHVFREHDVLIRGGDIISTADAGGNGTYETIDVPDMYIIPGLTDIHFHGCMGHDFCEGSTDVIQLMADYEESRGVTQICPATMTFPEDKLMTVMKAAREFSGKKGAALVGIDMEGPFISYEKRGAQNPEHIQKPDVQMFRRLNEASGNMIKLVALAPETEGAFVLISELKDEVKISFAHSTADYELSKKAFDSGIHHMTHIYNGMNTINHRNPGPVFAAAENPSVETEMICDGVHIAPAVVRATIKLFGEERIIFISDTMEAVGMPDGEYELGGLPVIKKGNRATLKDGTIAGSASDLMDCMRTAVLEMGIKLETAVRCAAVNPAISIGIYDRYGSIEAGKAANLAILDKELNLKQVYNRGQKVL